MEICAAFKSETAPCALTHKESYERVGKGKGTGMRAEHGHSCESPGAVSESVQGALCLRVQSLRHP